MWLSVRGFIVKARDLRVHLQFWKLGKGGFCFLFLFLLLLFFVLNLIFKFLRQDSRVQFGLYLVYGPKVVYFGYAHMAL